MGVEEDEVKPTPSSSPPPFPAYSKAQTASLEVISTFFEVLPIAFGDLSLSTSFLNLSSIANCSDSASSSCFHPWIHHFFEIFGFGFFKFRSINFKKLHSQTGHSTLLLGLTASISHRPRLHLASTRPRVDLTH
jgi:hypothetical protein